MDIQNQPVVINIIIYFEKNSLVFIKAERVPLHFY